MLFNEHTNNVMSAFAYIKDSLFAWSDNDAILSQDEADTLPYRLAYEAS